MKSIDKLKATSGLNGVAQIIGFQPKSLAYVLYQIPPASRYTQFTIPKASGGEREIMAPIERLKLVQRRLAKFLQNCLTEIEKEQNVNRYCTLSHGFKPELSIATNAKNHVNRLWVLNIDLMDFFPSINFGRVRGFFIKNKHFSLHEKTATVLAQIVCHENALPQGAPTSPVISNLIAGILDIHLNQLARKHRCTFTRYADDITFSTSRKEFPTEIAAMSPDGEWNISNRLSKQIKKSGFEINEKKTRMQYRRSRQDVTGLIVNAKLGVKRETLKTVRAQVEELIKTGKCFLKKTDGEETIHEDVSVDSLRGHLAHIAWVKGHYEGYEKIKRKWKKAKGKHKNDGRKKIKEWNKEAGYIQTYRKFLDHQAFVANPMPMIICEGYTDNIYIRCAMMRNSEVSNTLIAEEIIDGKTRRSLAVKLFRYTETTDWIQRLRGGTGDQQGLYAIYKERMQQVKATKIGDFKSPVILVVDHDRGAKSINKMAEKRINKAAKEHAKKTGKKCVTEKVDGSKNFYYLGLNLYLVLTPKTEKNNNIGIEKFLPKSALNKKLNNKTFEPDKNKFDKDKHYGKSRLANHVRSQKEIKLSKFRPLLERIEKAIDDFEEKKSKET